MRCRDARQWLRGEDLNRQDATAVQEHLQQCAACQDFAQEMEHAPAQVWASATPISSKLTTDRIMQAVQQRRRISQQLEDIRQQQQLRMQRMRAMGAACMALVIFTLSSIPLLLLAALLIRSDIALKGLYFLGGIIDLTIILAQYLQQGLLAVAGNQWLLSGLAFAVVIMMGMWLRLMRTPKEA
jgi:hypothetical protein